MNVTARDITWVMRTLHPKPVRLSVRSTEHGFLLRMPRACDRGPVNQMLWPWLADYIARRLGGQVAVTVTRNQMIKRRDYGKDVEFLVEVRPRS